VIKILVSPPDAGGTDYAVAVATYLDGKPNSAMLLAVIEDEEGAKTYAENVAGAIGCAVESEPAGMRIGRDRPRRVPS
jgi:hypothetical protein